MKASAHIFFCSALLVIVSCSAIKMGWTEDKAMNKFLAVTGNAKNFGDKRLAYNKGFRSGRVLDNFLELKKTPDAIYEYTTPRGADGIKLYYLKLDSVFVFEQPYLYDTFMAECRPMFDSERKMCNELKPH